MSRILRFFLDRVAVKFDAFKIKKFVDYVFVLVEKTIVKIDGFLPFYLSFYEDMIENEISLAEISSENKILHIGCGSIPATCILLAEKTHCQITGIDKDFRAVKQANKFIQNTRVAKQINIYHADGLDYSTKSFDIILVSQGIQPAYEILKKTASSIKKTSYVIYRTNILKNGELSDANMFLKDFFEIKKVLHQKKNALLASVLLSKK